MTVDFNPSVLHVGRIVGGILDDLACTVGELGFVPVKENRDYERAGSGAGAATGNGAGGGAGVGCPKLYRRPITMEWLKSLPSFAAPNVAGEVAVA